MPARASTPIARITHVAFIPAIDQHRKRRIDPPVDERALRSDYDSRDV
jgi:hypothetical protein